MKVLEITQELNSESRQMIRDTLTEYDFLMLKGNLKSKDGAHIVADKLSKDHMSLVIYLVASLGMYDWASRALETAMSRWLEPVIYGLKVDELKLEGEDMIYCKEVHIHSVECIKHNYLTDLEFWDSTIDKLILKDVLWNEKKGKEDDEVRSHFNQLGTTIKEIVRI